MAKFFFLCRDRAQFMDVIQRIATGDETPLLELYKQFRDEFIAFAFRNYGVDRESAKDIFQDVIVSFYENVKEGRLTELSSSLKTYLFAIGKHKLVNLAKKNDKSTYLDDFSLIKGFEPYSNEMENQEEKEFIRETVSRYLDAQPEDCQKILQMYYFEGLSMEQIAQKMGYKNADVAKSKKAICFKCLAEQVKKGLMMLIFFI